MLVENMSKYFTPTTIGSTAAVTGVIAVTALANSAAVLAGLAGVASTAIVAASLYRKLTHPSDRGC